MYRISRISICTSLLALGVVTCSGGSSDGHRFRVRTEDGVRVSETIGGPLYSSELFEYRELLSLTGDPSHEESLLFRPGAYMMGEDGHYYVMDVGNHRVAVFDSQGRYVRSFGREGRGPGEFVSMRLQSLRDGVLSIFDSSQRRTSRYSTDGTLIEVVTLSGGGSIRGLERTPDGTLVATSWVSSVRDEISYRTSRIIHLSKSGADTLAVIDSDEVGVGGHSNVGSTETRRRVVEYTLPYSARPTAEYVHGRGVLVSEGTTPRIRWYDLSGELCEEIRLNIELTPVTHSMRQRFIDDRRQMAEERAERTGRTMGPFPTWRFPDHIGLWSEAIVDDRGFIWLRAIAESMARPESDGLIIHVVSPDGEYLGVTELPGRFESIVGGRLLGYILVEETGEWIPTVYEILPMVEGLDYRQNWI